MKNKECSEEEIQEIIKDQNIEIHVFDDITLAVKRQDRVERQWVFTQLDALLKIYNYDWNARITQTIKKEQVVLFQPICETKKTRKKTHVTVLGDIFKTRPALIFRKHKFMNKFLRRASREFNIPFGYALRNPVDEPDPAHGVRIAVKRLLNR